MKQDFYACPDVNLAKIILHLSVRLAHPDNVVGNQTTPECKPQTQSSLGAPQLNLTLWLRRGPLLMWFRLWKYKVMHFTFKVENMYCC